MFDRIRSFVTWSLIEWAIILGLLNIMIPSLTPSGFVSEFLVDAFYAVFLKGVLVVVSPDYSIARRVGRTVGYWLQ